MKEITGLEQLKESIPDGATQCDAGLPGLRKRRGTQPGLASAGGRTIRLERGAKQRLADNRIRLLTRIDGTQKQRRKPAGESANSDDPLPPADGSQRAPGPP